MPIAKAKTLADFNMSHDKNTIITNRIEKGLAALRAAGPEAWEYAADFAKLAAVSLSDLAAYRDKYVDYIVEAPTIRTGGDSRNNRARDVWFGDKKVAAKVRNG